MAENPIRRATLANEHGLDSSPARRRFYLRHLRACAPLVLIALIITTPSVSAFHEKGVANCGGCHVLHGTPLGFPLMLGPSLLKGPNASDTCLICHAKGIGAVFGNDPLNPPDERGGGNFVFLLEENLNDGPDGDIDWILGDAAGHNPVAPGHGLFPDSRHSVSPGGSFLSSELGCTSCHDPHGNANFRMLHGQGSVVAGGLFTYIKPAPSAIGISLFGPAEASDHHTAYLDGMADWCSNCHGRFHQNGEGGLQHPFIRAFGAPAASQYNQYDGEEDLTGGTSATSYLAETPFEHGTNQVSSTAGPPNNARAMCLSCHRAHASSAPSAGRWDFNVGFLKDDGLRSGSYPIPDPYQSDIQGTLCHKCHLPIPELSPLEDLRLDLPLR